MLERGTLAVGVLAEMLDVSTQTIRRDIDMLCKGNTLRRRHGRVELADARVNTAFDERAGTNLEGKRAIGAAAARLIPEGATIFVSIGSTSLSVAQALRRHRGLTVITNNLSAAMALSEEVSNRIILPGGELRLPDRDILGDEVLDLFGRYRAEFGIFGTAGVAKDGGLLEFHMAEVQASEMLRANVRESVLVVDSSKFGRMAPALGANIDEIDRVIVDRDPGEDFAPLLDRIGHRLLLAEGEYA